MYALAKCVLLVTAAVAASSFNLGPNDVVFHLFKRSNPTQSQVLFPVMGSIAASNIDTSLRTIITIHSNEEFDNFNNHLVGAHLDAEDVNVLAVDWRAGASTYVEGVANADQAGQVVAQFVGILIGFGYGASQIRIIGVGLGAHVAGIAGRYITGTVPHIIALDPALHGWTHHQGRLGPDAAAVVEVLHTSAGFKGYDNPLGHIDFYANGGSFQTPCGIDTACSHSYSYVFYAESIRADTANGAKFVGTKCDDYSTASSLTCNGPRDAVFGGLSVKTGVSGIYVFRTNVQQPFALD